MAFAMRYNIAICIIAVLAVSPSASSFAAPVLDQERILKDWTLARCIGHSTNDRRTKNDAFISASALLERSKLPVEVHNRFDQRVIVALSKKYSGSIKGDYNILKCIDFYESSGLQALAKQAVAKLPRH